MALATQLSASLKYGWRSGLEKATGDYLKSLGIPFEYETLTIPYPVEETKRYTPDFILPNGIIVETKGRFVTADRKKHLLVQHAFPDLDIRIVFSNSGQRISKQSKTTYAMWCEMHGFRYAAKVIPRQWINEPAIQERLAAIRYVRQLRGE